jgi:hypothetical protein
MDKEKEWEIKENEFSGYYAVPKIAASEEICFVKDIQKVQLILFMMVFLQCSLSPSYAKQDVPIPQTVVDSFRKKTFSNHRFTQAEARKYIAETLEPIVVELKEELHNVTKDYLKREYAQNAITYEILQDMMKEQVLKSAKKSILDNDRNIKSLILVASSQINPYLPFKAGKIKAPSGRLPSCLPLKDPLALRVQRLEFELHGMEERLGDIEKLLLFQHDEIIAFKRDQETLIAWLKLSGCIITIFQVGKGTTQFFLSPWGREKIKKSKIFFFQKGEKICLVLLEKFKTQSHKE